MRLAVIPARGGSKRIPRKNVRQFFGKPIIAYTIEAAQASGCFDEVIVSTDDDEIAEVSRRLGANVPFIRPKELSDDHTGTNAVVAHSIRWFAKAGYEIEAACCLYATAPFLDPEVIKEGYSVLLSGSAEFVFSIAQFDFPVQRALRRDADGRLLPLFPDTFLSRSQDLEESFHDAGQFYWGSPDAFFCASPLFEKSCAGIELPRHSVQDIDTIDDWKNAELLYRLLRQKL